MGNVNRDRRRQVPAVGDGSREQCADFSGSKFKIICRENEGGRFERNQGGGCNTLGLCIKRSKTESLKLRRFVFDD
jgi:hypothetical protein